MLLILTVFPVLALNLFAIRVIAESTDVVNSVFGPVQGEILTTVGDGVRYSSFKGIPYAKPPIGDLRFQQTTFPDKWTDVLDATTAGSPCPQASSGLSGDVSYIGDEDCLYINVFTPLTDFSRRPNQLKAVIFWIHGGGFQNGSSDPDFYGPDFLIENDVVVVTLNYRLGALGFLAINDRRANGNVGLRDQSIALIWTYYNIEGFGGDKSKVTIIGQGAGGASALYHSLSSSSQGLFRSIIAMNGSPMNAWAFQKSDDALSNAYDLQCIRIISYADDIMQTLGSEDAKNIVTTAFKMSPRMFLPVRDNATTAPNRSPFLKNCMVDSWESGRFSGVPYILGFTEDPTLSFFQNNDTISALLNLAQIIANRSNIQSSVPSVYNVNRGDDNWTKQVVKETSDLLFKASIEHTRRYINKYSPPVYYYRLSYTDDQHSLHKLRGINENGVANRDELAYLWWIKSADMPLDSSSMISIIRSTMTRLFTNFAKYGNPTPDGMDDPVLETQWPNYAESPSHLEFGSEIKIDETSVVNENMEKIIEDAAPRLREVKDCTS